MLIKNIIESYNISTNSFNVIIEYIGSLIPEWVKDVAGFWNDGSINDASFLEDFIPYSK